MHVLLLLFAGCKTPESVPDTDRVPGTDSGQETDPSDTTLPETDEGLYGTFPDAPRPLPEFSATNYDGTVRAREDVLGHPTVMWFFPAAGTYG